MGSEIQRALLWILFGLSAFMLYDRWEVYNGRPSLLGSETQQVVTKEVNDTPVAKMTEQISSEELIKAVSKADLVTIETDLVKLEIDPNGATIVRSQLLNEKQQIPWTDTGLVGMVLGNEAKPAEDVVLFNQVKDDTYLAQTGLIGGPYPTHKTLFKLVSGPLKLEDGQNELEVVFEGTAGGVTVKKIYKLERGHYGIKVSHVVSNNSNVEIQPSVYYQFTRDDHKPAGEGSMTNSYTGAAVYTDKEKFQKVTFEAIADGEKDYQARANNGWVAMIQHYFVSAWIPSNGVERENYTRQISSNLYTIGSIEPMKVIAPGQTERVDAVLYSGPQDQERLDHIAQGLSLVVDYGWLTFLAQPIYWLLAKLHALVGNWGWAIVLLTCIVKAALYPLSLAGYRSMARMKDLGPRMKALREKYGDDKQRLNQAMMEMYKTEKINPVGGCLPILLQLPVFLALYWVLLASVELRDAPWIFWIHDLAAPDPWFILPILMIITMVLQFKLNPTPPDPVQAKVMAFMPYVFGIMFIFFASGLVLYWLINNILSIVQQYMVNKQIAADRLKRQLN
ncbi:MAG: membrane protein insertase YidC [Burkholderiaceae bacterium]|nr:membrane protein insertase YidC [Burkholderiaceae bacterium]